MPDAPQDVSPDAKKGLIAKILKSEAFKGTEDLPRLLRFLAENEDKLLAAKEVEAFTYSHFKSLRRGKNVLRGCLSSVGTCGNERTSRLRT